MYQSLHKKKKKKKIVPITSFTILLGSCNHHLKRLIILNKLIIPINLNARPSFWKNQAFCFKILISKELPHHEILPDDFDYLHGVKCHWDLTEYMWFFCFHSYRQMLTSIKNNWFLRIKETKYFWFWKTDNQLKTKKSWTLSFKCH